VNELQFADDVFERLRQQGAAYDERAFVFVLAAIQYLQSKLRVRRHVTSAELAWACRDFGLDQFGLMAREVLEYWGVRETADLGRIVFSLVDIGLLITQPGDREDDFAGVFDFAQAFQANYIWRGVSAEDRIL